MIFITQGRYTQAAMKGMVASPEDRTEQIKKLFEGTGARVIGCFITLGEYDFLIIAEGNTDLPSFMTGLAIAASGGGVTDLKSTVAITATEMKDVYERAKERAQNFRPAGQAGA